MIHFDLNAIILAAIPTLTVVAHAIFNHDKLSKIYFNSNGNLERAYNDVKDLVIQVEQLKAHVNTLTAQLAAAQPSKPEQKDGK